MMDIWEQLLREAKPVVEGPFDAPTAPPSNPTNVSTALRAFGIQPMALRDPIALQNALKNLFSHLKDGGVALAGAVKVLGPDGEQIAADLRNLSSSASQTLDKVNAIKVQQDPNKRLPVGGVRSPVPPAQQMSAVPPTRKMGAV